MAKRTRKEPPTPTPATGESTRQQGWIAGAGYGGVLGYGLPFAGSYENYRAILLDPTVQLARSIVMAPIRAGSWTFDAAEGTPAERVDFVRDTMTPLRDAFIADVLRALDYGWSPFEQVWDVAEGRWVTRRLKPLLVDITTIMVDKWGNPIGLRQGGDELPLIKSFFYTYDGEAGNHYGRSRLENVRLTVAAWLKANESAGKLGTKAAGIIAVIKFPPGVGKNEQGEEISRVQQAMNLGAKIVSGSGYLAVENYVGLKLDSVRDAETLVKLSQGSMWHIETLDLGDTGPAMEGSIREREYLDRLKFRGYLRPERAGLEGEHGTKAEAGVHTDTGTTDSELLDRDIAIAVNRGIVDDMLELNFGVEARGTVFIKPQPLRDTQAIIDQMLIEAMMKNASIAPVLWSVYDMDAVLARRGVQKRPAPVALPAPAKPDPANDPNKKTETDGQPA